MSSSERNAGRGARTAALVACAALAAAACGFHLQGRDRLPEYMAVVYAIILILMIGLPNAVLAHRFYSKK
jgi:outer membrane lipopolysaccharide assembly protein LptE/RlpB